MYNHKKIEKKWQKKWLIEKVHRAADFSQKPKYYQLETFPYPSAAGLHVGHPKGYIAEDVHARFMRMNGREVLYTMGWDAFGLPTENYAIKVGKAPQEVAKANIKNFKRQVRMFGLSYDWDREINTSDSSYYKWTQWLFIQLFKKGLAYRAKAKVNWCPKDQTVLANEQVINGRCERCGTEVGQREMEQWFLKITAYADRLLEDLGGLDWPEATIKRQEDWIGRSEGVILEFRISNFEFRIKVFTTRPDTLAGAMYLVLAPEHPLVANNELGIGNYGEVEKYINQAKNKTDLERQENKEKTGIELKSLKAINPLTKEEISIWVADYVLGGYGTGAIMAVPAHDQRDWEFAKKFNLPIKMVICTHYPEPTCPVMENAYEGEGALVGSGQFDGLKSPEARKKITQWLEKNNLGQRKINYKLRDWSVSRQRYWGVPIPMIFCENCRKKSSEESGIGNQESGVMNYESGNSGWIPVLEEDLPVILPRLEDYRPKGVPPLASSEKFLKVKCPQCGSKARRDPETLDTFVDSSWYYLAYASIQNSKFEIRNSKLINYWLPVDLYVIGAEHTVLHLLYSRFITKFLYDEGYLKFREPFLKLRHVGLILGADGQKMSKSKGNVVNPDELVEKFGADAVRVYEMFMGPFGNGQPWDPRGVVGASRFLNKIWTLFFRYCERSEATSSKSSKLQITNHKQIPNPKFQKLLHQTVKKVTEDIQNFHFNTAISALMILVNDLDKEVKKSNSIIHNSYFIILVKLIFPFAPHLAQELWENLGLRTLLDYESWPTWDKKLIVEEEFDLVVQINGKLRGTVKVVKDLDQKSAEKLAQKQEFVKKWLAGSKIKKIIFVKDRLINFII